MGSSIGNQLQMIEDEVHYEKSSHKALLNAKEIESRMLAKTTTLRFPNMIVQTTNPQAWDAYKNNKSRYPVFNS